MALRKSQRVQVGSIDKYVSVFAIESTDDGQGGTSVQEVHLFDTWASLKPVRADRILNVDRTVQNTTHTGLVRWRNDLQDFGYIRSTYDNQLRLGLNDRIFTINTAHIINEDEFIVEFTATEEAYDNR